MAFKKIKLYWATSYFKRKMGAREQAIETVYIAVVLLTNTQSYVCPSAVIH